MNGPEHYAESERLVAVVDNGQACDTDLSATELLAMAQVHATLALAAACAPGSNRDLGEWQDVTEAVHGG